MNEDTNMTNVEAICDSLKVNPVTHTISDFEFKQVLWAHLENGLLTQEEFMTIMDTALDRAIFYGMDFEAHIAASQAA